MKIINKIENLVESLNNLKLNLSQDAIENKKSFQKILADNLNGEEAQNGFQEQASKNTSTTSQKPNMRQMIERLSGKTVEDLYAGESSGWKECSKLASEILYGVVGNSKHDTRDWEKIMGASNVKLAASEATREMHLPIVDIETEFDDAGNVTDQYATIKDYSGQKLRAITATNIFTEEVLESFGIQKDSIPDNLDKKIVSEKFDKNLIDELRRSARDNIKIAQLTQNQVLEMATKNVAERLDSEIPFEEFIKL